MTKQLITYSAIFLVVFFTACNQDETDVITDPVNFVPGVDVVYLPVVVHVIHSGEPVGMGPNLSDERILRQIEILNEDFRKREGTRGYNNHPDGGDAMMEFVLARQTPEGDPSNGINRIDTTQVKVPNMGYNQNHFAQYSYWDPSLYINIWTTPLPESTQCLVLGSSSGPKTDLPGTELLVLPGPKDAEGIMINWIHFGESDIDCHAKYGRTLTHEMGHYFGLLHPWGAMDCDFNDYCGDTPAVDVHVFGRTSFVGCQGDRVMIENYMNYTDDEVMNIFTHEQIGRMHYVLKNHEGRNSLLLSIGLETP